MSITTWIVDDHPVVISGLQKIFARYPQIALTRTFGNAKQLLEGVKTELPDVLFLDIQLPDITGEQLIPLLLKKNSHLKILILTNYTSTLYLNSMLRLGALGYILKTSGEDLIIEAIEAVSRGHQFIDPTLKDDLRNFERIARRESTMRVSLTGREREILQLIADGLTGHQIAEKTFLSFNTVEHYRKNILLKLDVKNTASLIRKSLWLGLIK